MPYPSNGKMIQRRTYSVIFFQINLLCSTTGFLLYAPTDLTAQSFSLVCDLQEIPWISPLSFTYNGNPAGGCNSPPGSCGSPIGTITTSGTIVTFVLNQNEILNKGTAEWKCVHGSDSVSYNATVIALCQNGEVKYEENKIFVRCNCGYPNVQADIVYKGCADEDSLGSTMLNLESSSASCSSDGRAMNFSSNITDFPSGTAKVCATLRIPSQKTNPETICGSVVPDCGDSDAELFLRGFSVFLIVFGTAIIIIIIIMIFKKLGITKLKVIVIGIFVLIALVIGLSLGFGIKEKNLSLGLGLGFGFFLAAANSVTICVIHVKKYDSEKDDKDEERKGKDSHASPVTENGNQLKESNRPLPEPPATRRNKLEPIPQENDGVTTSEKKKKKKKKKKKRKNTESTDALEDF